MPTVIVRFVQATYALATFVHISIISPVTSPIVTELFGPNFLGVIVFRDQNVLGPNLLFLKNFFQAKNLFGLKDYSTLQFLWTQKFLDPTFLWTQSFFWPIFFFLPNFFWTQYLFGTWRLPLEMRDKLFPSWTL